MPKDVAWTTREGVVIPIVDLADSHLVNIINMLNHQSPIGTRYHTTAERRTMWLAIINAEAQRRGLSETRYIDTVRDERALPGGDK
jgi:hypothetical protein